MSVIKPIYRLEVRAPRTEEIFTGVSNDQETAILQPTAGAVHRDWFRVASEAVSFSAGLAGTTASWIQRAAVLSWPTTAQTIEIWYRANDTRRTTGLFSYAVSADVNETMIRVHEVSGAMTLEVWVNGTRDIAFASSTLLDGKWHQLVITWQSSNGAEVAYLDGSQIATGTGAAAAITAGGTLFVGQEQNTFGGGLDKFEALDGAVAMVRVYNRVLTAQEAAEHYRGIYTSETGLVLSWDFEGMGRGTKVTTVTDKSGTGNNGTAQGVEWLDDTPTGFKPFLMSNLGGRNARIDVQDRGVDIGSRTVILQDQRTDISTFSNLKRWWTAYTGDAKGRLRGRLKTILEESLDDGVTWARIQTGRVISSSLNRTIRVELELRDEAEALKMKIFVGTPHSSIGYVALRSLLPLGTLGGTGYGPLQSATAFSGTAHILTVSGVGTLNHARWIGLTTASLKDTHNVLTDDLRNVVAPDGLVDVGVFDLKLPLLPNFSGPGRARLKHTSGVLNGQTGDYKIGLIGKFVSDQKVEAVSSFAIEALISESGTATGTQTSTTLQDTTKTWIVNQWKGFTVRIVAGTGAGQTRTALSNTANTITIGTAWSTTPDGTSQYAIGEGQNALPLPADGVTCDFHIFVDYPATEGRPLLINDIDPATLLQDLCDGKFGYFWKASDPPPVGKSAGDPIRSVATNGLSSFVGTQPPFRGIITDDAELIDWVEENLLVPSHWAMYLDTQGRLNLVELRLPSSLAGISTLVDADLLADQDPGWEHDPTAAVKRLEITRYHDTLITATIPVASGPEILRRLMRPTIVLLGAVQGDAVPIDVIFTGSIDYGDETMKIDATGFRSSQGETLQGQTRSTYLENKLIELSTHIHRLFGWGLATIDLECKRTPTVNALTPGGLILLNVSWMPDPNTNQRGGTQLCRVLELTPNGATMTVRLLHLAVNAVAPAPSLTQPTTETGNTYFGVSTTLTLASSGGVKLPAAVRYAVTTTAVGSPPVDSSPLWTVIGPWLQGGLFHTDGVVAIRRVPPGQRVWVQARTEPDPNNAPQLPSAWVLAAGTGRADTTALPAPSAPTISLLSNKSARLSWTNGATDVTTEILLASPVTDPRKRIATLLAGSTLYDFRDLIPNTTYRAEIRHSMNGGQYISTGVTVDFTTAATGTATTATVGVSIIK